MTRLVSLPYVKLIDYTPPRHWLIEGPANEIQDYFKLLTEWKVSHDRQHRIDAPDEC